MQATSSKNSSRSYYRSSSFKMAVFFTLLLGLSAMLLAYLLYDFGNQNFIRETEAAIDREMQYILNVTRSMSEKERLSYIEEKALGAENTVYYLRDKREHTMAGNMAHMPAEVSRLSEGVIGFTLEYEGNLQQMAAKIHTFPNGSRLLIGRDITAIIANHNQLKLITALVMGFMLVVVLVSFFISIFVVGRINTIATTARAIMETSDLSERIAVKGSWDDLSNLAQILNGLLAQIESLMQGIRDVTDGIAHDLRTPLTRLRHQLETMQEGNAHPDDIKQVLAEVDSMLDTFQALLRIANIEKGKRYQAFSEVNLTQILHDVIELYEPLAEDKAIHIHAELSENALYHGDRDLLFQAFANLLDNAIKYSPDKGNITVQLQIQDQGYLVIIADKGLGVAHNDLPKLFDRFYRADKSRTHAGSGLGLSLVKAVIDLHKAEIRLEDNAPGLRVAMRL